MEHKGEFFDSYGNNPGYYDISFTNYLKNTLMNGILTNANCKAFGQVCVDNIVYFIYTIEHKDKV
jgi:hypothetical protein